MSSSILKEDEVAAVSSSSSSHQLLGRRPMNAFLLFCKRHRDTVKEKYPSLENRSITKILGDWWSSLSSEDKSAYTDLAQEYKLHLSTFSSSSKDQSEEEFSAENACSAAVASAPKPFKKRFLAAATTVSSNSSSSSPSESGGGEGKSPEEVENDDVACKALLQLAGVRDSPTPLSASEKGDEENSNSSSNIILNNNGGGGVTPKEPPEEGFRTLKKAVWGRVAKTLLKQEEERLTSDENGDSPINLSTQCTIRGQTIIEHIIENILDKSPPPSSLEDEESSSAGGEGQLPYRLNNNNNPFNSLDSSSEQIKERIYQSLKEDMGVDRPDMSALRKSLPNPLAKKPPPPPPILKSTGGAQEEEEKQRPSRSCKGRRYQEFKEEGRFGRKRRHRSGGSSPAEETPAARRSSPPLSLSSSHPPESHKTPHPTSHTPCKPFNVSAKLNALPVLSLEDYQRKMSKIKSGSRRKSGDEEMQQQQQPSSLSRRQSRSRNEREQLIA